MTAASHPSSEDLAPQVIDLWPEGVPGLKPDAGPERIVEETRLANIHCPNLTYYPAPFARANGTGIIICPGGAYLRLSMENEGAAIARWLNSLGIAAFVLKSRLVEYGQPAPLQDVLRALRTVRSSAASFGVRADRIGLIGFSAGGHLAASAATLHESPEGKTGAAIDAVRARPDFTLLIYPVITMEPPFAHGVSRESLLGPNPASHLVARWSPEKHVQPDTPPAFIAHAQDDGVVPVENAVQYYLALRQSGVPAELHLYETGGHGFGLRPDAGRAACWVRQAEDWLQAHGLRTKS